MRDWIPVSNSCDCFVFLSYSQEEDPPAGIVSGFRKWLHLQLETGKAQRKAKSDLKKAKRAMSAAEEMIVGMEESLNLEEEDLNLRANVLRRQSVGTFKVRLLQRAMSIGRR